MQGDKEISVIHRFEQMDAELTRLRSENAELQRTLRFAIPAVEWLIEHYDINTFECDQENPCGAKVCESTGCLVWKAHLIAAHKAANTAKEPV